MPGLRLLDLDDGTENVDGSNFHFRLTPTKPWDVHAPNSTTGNLKTWTRFEDISASVFSFNRNNGTAVWLPRRQQKHLSTSYSYLTGLWVEIFDLDCQAFTKRLTEAPTQEYCQN